MTVSMTGELLVGPTYAVPSVSCRGREVNSRGETVLFVRVGAEEDLQRVPACAVSEDSEVLDVGDQGALVLLESVARRLGWVEEERAAGSCIANNPLLYNSALSSIEVRALADAAAERRLDKLPCTREGAKTALSLTFQVWAEWQDPSPCTLFPDPIETCALDGKTRPEVGLLFLEWVRGLLPGILAECLPDTPSSGASAGSMNVDPTDAGQVRAAVLSGAPVFLGHDANANPTAHVVKVARAIQRELKKGESNLNIGLEAELDDALMTLESDVPLEQPQQSTITLAQHDTPDTKLGTYTHPSLPGDYVEETPDGLSTLRRASGQPVMVVATAALGRTGQCPWCDACYSTRDELLRHLDHVGRHEGARLVLAEARVASLDAEAERALRVCEETRGDLLKTRQRVAELQAVVDAYGEHGHSVVVKAGEDGEVDVWSDGHAHAFAPLSTIRALRERVAELETVAESTRCELTAPDGHGAQQVTAWDSLVALRRVLSKRCTCGLDDFDSDHKHDAKCPLALLKRGG
jgi:hypothetical protein